MLSFPVKMRRFRLRLRQMQRAALAWTACLLFCGFYWTVGAGDLIGSAQRGTWHWLNGCGRVRWECIVYSKQTTGRRCPMPDANAPAAAIATEQDTSTRNADRLAGQPLDASVTIHSAAWLMIRVGRQGRCHTRNFIISSWASIWIVRASAEEHSGSSH